MVINFLLSILAGVISAFIYDKIKNHSNANKSGWEFDLKIKFKKFK
ncbi:TPA: type I toxin-antitoxin system toxin [Clostridioides difficile]|nr:hypothetical protein [Clostridioides difficile]MCG3604179.1 hypothetical protein [Clostridioides difficile]MCI9897748.1 hypothetical protein [Clostridioides difficile]MCI9970648.1 hypothetical protein [Clostridioides difficile]MCJ0167838.1 hypothetical protein [Clostridioides difficile]MCJ0187820.1 hypothetical protein [Clostridioides difficile]